MKMMKQPPLPPQPQEAPAQEYRIEVIQTGKDYITREERYRRIYSNLHGGYGEQPAEQIVISISSGSSGFQCGSSEFKG